MRRRISHIFQLTRPAGIIGQSEFPFPDTPKFLPTSVEPGESTCEQSLGIHPVLADDQLAAIVFTSGSTGKPKGVQLPHRVLAGNACATAESLSPASDDRLFINIPFHFISAISHFLTALRAGIQFHGTEEKRFASDFLQDLIQSGANCFGGSPVQFRWVADYLEAGNPGGLHLDWLMSSGDHLPDASIQMLKSHISAESRLFVVYGLTELGGRFCVLPPHRLADKRGTVGIPIDGLSVSIRDRESGILLSPSEVGEVYVSGEWLFQGYCSDNPKDSSVLDEFGFRTGDLGSVDEDGFLKLLGRSDDVFKVAGLKVSSTPIVSELLKLESVEDAAVVGWEVPTYGTVPAALLVMSKGKTFSRTHVVAALRQCLPSNHIPRTFRTVDSIPRTGSGKVKRAEVRKMLDELAE